MIQNLELADENLKIAILGNSLAVQWLGLWASTARGTTWPKKRKKGKRKCHWGFDRDCTESVDQLGSIDILIIVSLPVHEHGTCLHLFLSLISFLFLKNIYLFILFIWLRQVLVAAYGLFLAVCRIFSYGMWDVQLQHVGSLVGACGIFSCGMQDLVPWPGIEPRPPALGARSFNDWTTREVPLSLI